jgi:hypothetical protein
MRIRNTGQNGKKKCLYKDNFVQVAFAEAELTQFTWLVSEEQQNEDGAAGTKPAAAKKPKAEQTAKSDTRWTERSRGYLYRPCRADLGRLLRLDVTPARSDCIGDTRTIISKAIRHGMSDLHQLLVVATVPAHDITTV